jgi:putative acetyltransferase
VRLSFRAAGSADLPELVDLWVESWSEVYDGIDFDARRGWFVDHIGAWTGAGGLCLAAFDGADGAMAGFILHKADEGHLDQLCVRRDRKGRGVAPALMAEAKRLSPDGVHLDVNAMNLRAIRFYEREGFVKTGEGVSPTSGLPIFRYRWRP